MISLPSARRRADEFAAAVDAPAAAAEHPELRAPRRRSSSALRGRGGAATPRAEFSASLRERLMAEAARRPRRPAAALTLPTRRDPRPRAPPRRRRLRVRARRRYRRHGGGRPERAAGRRALPDQARPRARPGRPDLDDAGKGATCSSRPAAGSPRPASSLDRDARPAEVGTRCATFTDPGPCRAPTCCSAPTQTGATPPTVAPSAPSPPTASLAQPLAQAAPPGLPTSSRRGGRRLQRIDAARGVACADVLRPARARAAAGLRRRSARRRARAALAAAPTTRLDNSHPLVPDLPRRQSPPRLRRGPQAALRARRHQRGVRLGCDHPVGRRGRARHTRPCDQGPRRRPPKTRRTCRARSTTPPAASAAVGDTTSDAPARDLGSTTDDLLRSEAVRRAGPRRPRDRDVAQVALARTRAGGRPTAQWKTDLRRMSRV